MVLVLNGNQEESRQHFGESDTHVRPGEEHSRRPCEDSLSQTELSSLRIFGIGLG